jgi:hypothetical protein
MQDLREQTAQKRINFWSNIVIAQMFVISVINIFISTFGMDFPEAPK